MTNSVYAKLGIKHAGNKALAKLGKHFGGVVGREQLKQFKETVPDLFSTLYTKMCSVQTKKGDLKTGGRLPLQSLFDFLYPEHDASCLTCGTAVAWADDRKRYREFCSTECSNSSSEIVARRKQTCLDRFGMEPNLHPSIKKKKVKTFQANYGVDNPSQSEEVKIKKRDTCLEHYGVAHHTQAGISSFHTANPMHTEQGKANLRRTCIERYGVPYAMQSPIIKKHLADSNELKYGGNPGAIPHGFRRKIAYDKFGKKHVVQGYEPLAIEWFSSKKNVTRITSTYRKIPKIKYKDSKGDPRTYRPDLVVRCTDGARHVIEVKGSWTLRIQLGAVVTKAQAATRYCLRNGYTYWVFFYRDSGELVRLKNPSTEAPFLELLKLGRS